MAANYSVQAEVVDIRKDSPKATDSFFVDTQIWLWTTYTKATPKPYQTRYYPSYFSRARHVRAKLFWCGLSQSELAHLIESTERQLFEKANPHLKLAHVTAAKGWLPPKEFRHNYSAERASVVAEVQAAWGKVTTMASCIVATVDEPATVAALSRFQTQPLDGYDLFMLEAVTKAGIVQILSDDGDYCTVGGIRVFTANDNVINLARAAGKLIVR